MGLIGIYSKLPPAPAAPPRSGAAFRPVRPVYASPVSRARIIPARTALVNLSSVYGSL